MINPWFKFYGGEYLSDPKISALTPQERSCWITLLCLSGTSSVPGIIEYLTIEVLLEKSGVVRNTDEYKNCLGVFEKLKSMKMIETRGNVIEVLNWGKRQETTLSATERSRKYRLKQRINDEYATKETKRNENETLEKNRIEKNRVDTNTSVSKKLIKPTLKEVTDYCQERKNSVNPQTFIDHYESNGWKVGGRSSMKDWKASIRTWEKNSFNTSKSSTVYKNTNSSDMVEKLKAKQLN